MKSLIVLNALSGGFRKIDIEKVKKDINEGEESDVIVLRNENEDFTVEGYDKLYVYGGDGTLNTAINKCYDKPIEIFYVACGTFNEKAKVSNKTFTLQSVGKANDRFFSYVLACGTLTEIGYSAKKETKKRFRLLAYFSQILKFFTPRFYTASIESEGLTTTDVFTLIMILDSPRCFGFRFNRMYEKEQSILHVLTIKSPKHKGFLGKLEIFFPFFRTFFIGFSKRYDKGKLHFFETETLKLTLLSPIIFCIDGEAHRFTSDSIFVNRSDTLAKIHILKK